MEVEAEESIMATAVKPISATATLPMDAELLGALTLIGRIVHVDQSHYTVHSVEGESWYAFNQDGQVTVDTNMTIPSWLEDRPATATLIPLGHNTGEGYGHTVPLTWVSRGWSLVKANDGEW